MLTKRLEILLNPGEYKEIQREARERRESVGQLVRDLLREKMVKPRKKTVMEAFKKLFSKEKVLPHAAISLIFSLILSLYLRIRFLQRFL